MNELAIKTYEVNYDFIIKNYLDVSLWEKRWNIFQYKNFNITMYLNSINCRDKRITLCFNIKDSLTGRESTDCVNIDLQHLNMNVLKRQVKGVMETNIRYIELAFINNTEYEELKTMLEAEQDKLDGLEEEIRDELSELDEEYVDIIVEKRRDEEDQSYYIKEKFNSNMKYKVLTDLWIGFYKSVGDDEKVEMIEKLVGGY